MVDRKMRILGGLLLMLSLLGFSRGGEAEVGFSHGGVNVFEFMMACMIRGEARGTESRRVCCYDGRCITCNSSGNKGCCSMSLDPKAATQPKRQMQPLLQRQPKTSE